ncbi:MAG: PDZ domain-containing protein [Candidatus Acidiferrales bacterium]|jgi:serine protease Do
MKTRSKLILTSIAIAALLAATIPSVLRSQQQPPAPPAAPQGAPPDGPAMAAMPRMPALPALPDAVELATDRVMPIEDGSGWLGIAIEEVSADKAKELKLPADRGVFLTDVQQDSPAAKAGLKSGDVIVEYDGQRVEGTLAFRRMVRETPPGRSIAIGYWRDGQSDSLTVELGSLTSEIQDHALKMADRAREMAEQHVAQEEMAEQFGEQMAQMPMVLNIPENAGLFAGNTPRLGIGALDLSGQLGKYFGAPDGQGVLVSEVRDSTPAAKAGLQAGDVITKLDGEPVRNVGELRGKLAEKRDAKTVTLTILRKGTEMPVTVEPQAPPAPQPAVDTNRHVSMKR